MVRRCSAMRCGLAASIWTQRRWEAGAVRSEASMFSPERDLGTPPPLRVRLLRFCGHHRWLASHSVDPERPLAAALSEVCCSGFETGLVEWRPSRDFDSPERCTNHALEYGCQRFVQQRALQWYSLARAFVCSEKRMPPLPRLAMPLPHFTSSATMTAVFANASLCPRSLRAAHSFPQSTQEARPCLHGTRPRRQAPLPPRWPR